MRLWMAGALLWPGVVWAEAWEQLTGEQIAEALSARVVVFPEGVAQDFRADGRTIRAGAWGEWRVEGDRYCEVWVNSRPICAAVDRQGITLRFREETGFVRLGHYGDL